MFKSQCDGAHSRPKLLPAGLVPALPGAFPGFFFRVSSVKPALSIVSNDLRDPPYPAGTKAKGLALRMDIERIRQSDTWALASSEIRPWLLMLWLCAWDRVPCGSYPDDDEVIAAVIGMPPVMFATYRKVLMRGWWRAGDGRLYHPVLSELVHEMLQYRSGGARRVAEWRRNKNQQLATDVTRNQRVSNTPVREPEPEPEPKPRKAMSSRLDAAREVLSFLNNAADRNYRPVDANLKPISARISETSVDHCKAVIHDRVAKWKGDPKMDEYLRPATLFGAEKFHQYLPGAEKDFFREE